MAKYSTLNGTPLPLFARQRMSSRKSLRRLLCYAVLLFGLLNVVTWYTLVTHETREIDESRGRLLHGLPRPPVMTDRDALAAMYPSSAGRVPLGSNSSIACAQQHTLLIVADMDRASRNGSVWESFLRRGSLCLLGNGSYHVSWVDEVPLRSRLNEAGRGMELSTLTWFRGKVWLGYVVLSFVLWESKGHLITC
ncbi:MAG: hypothetical protein SGPRY_006539 [Prymnesium sp.]